MRLLQAALGAASRALGLTRATPDQAVPDSIREQRERAARALPRRASRMSRAWVVVRGGFLLDHGRMDRGQRDAVRAGLRRHLQSARRRRSRLLGDGLAWRTLDARLQGRTRGPSGATKRRTRHLRTEFEGLPADAQA